MESSIVVVDIEATCWEHNRTPPGQQSEIIEVGLCLLNLESLTPSGKRSIMVRPTRSTVSTFCTALTTITPEMAAAGTTFAEACRILREEVNTPALLWSSWGNYDLRMFTHQCESFGVAYPFGPRHLNIKACFARLHKRKRVGLKRALALSNLEQQGTHHRGHDDAWNTARVLAVLIEQYGLEAVLENVNEAGG